MKDWVKLVFFWVFVVILLVVALGASPNKAMDPEQVTLVSRLLTINGADSARADSVAPHLVRYAMDENLDPLLVVGVIGVENRQLVPRARSSAGARGIMQIMPFWTRYHANKCGTDLTADTVNLCYGTTILRANLDATQDTRRALLRYNGCVKSPGCTSYPTHVFARVGQALIIARGQSLN